VSLIMSHIGYGGIVYAGADVASQRRLNLAFGAYLRYILSLRWLDHVSHLETTVMGTSLGDYAKIQLLSFLYKVLHVHHPCYLFSLFRFFVCAYEELGSPGTSLSCNESVLLMYLAAERRMRCLMA
jgi:hypothetical protein